MGIFMWILVGLVAGWLTGKIMKGSGYGFFVDILLGIAGALVGGFIASHLGLDPHGGFIYSTLDRRWRRGHPGGHPSADQEGLTAGLTAHDGCLPLPGGTREGFAPIAICRRADLIPSRQLTMACAAGGAV